MSALKFEFGFLLNSLIIVTGTYILKKSISQILESMAISVDISNLLWTISIIFFSVLLFLKTTKFSIYKDKEFYASFMIFRENLGKSIAISSCILTFMSFATSFYDFEGSLTTLYTAFVFMITSIILIYGNTGVPDSTVVLAASYISLLLAFLGLTIMITPNMMNSAFVVSSTAAFSLVVSAVLFLMSATRSDKVEDGFRLNDRRIITSSEILGSLDFIDEIAEEVFAEEEPELTDFINENVNIKDAISPGVKNSDNFENKVSKQVDLNENIEAIVEGIIKDLTEQAKSIDRYVDYFLSKVSV